MSAVRRGLGVSAVALMLAAALSQPAWAVDVSNLSSIEADPCFQQAHQRALDSNLGVIESQIVAACTDAHGNPTEAMALLKDRARLPPWLPPAAGGFGATTVLAAALAELAALALLLGVDLGYAARALDMVPSPGIALPFGQVATRLAMAALLTALATLPTATILLALGLLVFAVRACRWTAPQAADSEKAAGGMFAILATDLLGNLPVSLGIAAVSRGSFVLAGGGVLLAALAARLLHPTFTRLLRQRPVMVRVAAAVLAAIAGSAALSDSALPALPGVASLAIPLGLAVLVAAFGQMGRHTPATHSPAA